MSSRRKVRRSPRGGLVAMLLAAGTVAACGADGTSAGGADCEPTVAFDTSRGECTETLAIVPAYDESVVGDTRTITSNGIPGHEVGLFGPFPGSLNPNPIREQSETYRVAANPVSASVRTWLLSSTGPRYSFGVLRNGVELDPVAAEPWPHEGPQSPNANWEWNLEALNVSIGLDCNNAHVQPSGKYHYHGDPTGYLADIHPPADTMTLVGFAADGFPVYFRYGYAQADDAGSGVIALASGWRLRSGERPGDGTTAPCGAYDGTYSADFEYVEGLGDLDECNGRWGVTPEYPGGTYYYVLTQDYPVIPRCFRGTPSVDFRIGP